jgi:phospholipid transport system transporter-binding protein
MIATPAAPVEGGFRPLPGGERWAGHGAITSANAGAVLRAAEAQPLPTAGVVDCADIAAVDSAAVAVLLALKRRGVEAGRALAFVGIPAPLRALIGVYGVEEMLAE